MRETRILMGMPVTVEITDAAALQADVYETIRAAFDYFASIDERFSTYKNASEITAINEGRLKPNDWSEDTKTIFRLAEETEAAFGRLF